MSIVTMNFANKSASHVPCCGSGTGSLSEPSFKDQLANKDYSSLYGTKVCRHWSAGRRCPMGDTCGFAHGEPRKLLCQFDCQRYNLPPCSGFHRAYESEFSYQKRLSSMGLSVPPGNNNCSFDRNCFKFLHNECLFLHKKKNGAEESHDEYWKRTHRPIPLPGSDPLMQKEEWLTCNKNTCQLFEIRKRNMICHEFHPETEYPNDYMNRVPDPRQRSGRECTHGEDCRLYRPRECVFPHYSGPYLEGRKDYEQRTQSQWPGVNQGKVMHLGINKRSMVNWVTRNQLNLEDYEAIESRKKEAYEINKLIDEMKALDVQKSDVISPEVPENCEFQIKKPKAMKPIGKKSIANELENQLEKEEEKEEAVAVSVEKEKPKLRQRHTIDEWGSDFESDSEPEYIECDDSGDDSEEDSEEDSDVHIVMRR
jgi:hypothetical protein